MVDPRGDDVLRLQARVAELERQVERLSEAEEQILGARAQAQALLDNIPHMAWMKNTHGVFLAVNEPFARACGRAKPDILGKTDRDVWPPEHAERYMADDRQVMASGERCFVEEPISEGGDVKWFETLKSPIRDSHGSVIGTVGLARDITERKRAERQRQLLEQRINEAQKLESLGVLAGGIAHDFNNLLVGVLSSAELAMAAVARSHARREVLDRLQEICDAADHARELTNQMLAYSGQRQLDVRPLSLNRAAREMSHLLSASVSKKAQLRHELSDGLPTVRADASQLRQVIMNLIINASEALLDGAGTIVIRTGTQHVEASPRDLHGPTPLASGAYVFLEVSDDGCGMNAETQARLFEPFFTTKFTGRGLGLSAVQGIIRGHDGGIVLRSALGAGTTVRVLLPVCGDAPAPLRQKPDALRGWKPSGLVLLVDDDARVRHVTQLLLEELGFQVLTATNGRDAIRQFARRAEEFRAVVLDVTMPDLSGDQVLRALRQRRCDVPVLVCSGYSSDEVRERFMPEEMAGFLQKPYSLETLESRLRSLLEPPPRSHLDADSRDIER